MTSRTSMAIKLVAPYTDPRPRGLEVLKRSDGPWLAVLYRGPAGTRRGIVQQINNAFSEAGSFCLEGWYHPPEYLWLVCRGFSSRAKARERVKAWIYGGV